MDEYIKKKDLLKAFPKAEADVFENCRNCTCLDSEQIEDIINSIPAADVVERKKGKWVLDTIYPSGLQKYKCSFCKFTRIKQKGETNMNFCPNCGAKMETDTFDDNPPMEYFESGGK